MGARTFQSASALSGNRQAAPRAMKASANKVSALTRELWAQWQQTKMSWKDERAQEFEHRYMEELVSSVDRAVTVIDQLDKLITKVRKDCE
jgi:thymidylate synthase